MLFQANLANPMPAGNIEQFPYQCPKTLILQRFRDFCSRSKAPGV